MMSIRGRSPEPSPCGYDISGLATAFASLRRATRSDAPERVGVGEPHPARGFVLLARCRPSQERFRTRERQSGAPGIERVCINEARQERAVEIALHLPGPVSEARVRRWLSGFFTYSPVVWSNWLSRVRYALNSTTPPPQASALRRSGRHEHPGAAHLGGAAEGALEGAVRELLRLDGAALGEDPVRELAVGALALCGEAPLALPPLLGEPLVAARAVPLLLALLRAAAAVEVVRVRGAAGAVHRPLEPAQLAPRLLDRGAEPLEHRVLSGDRRDGRRANVEADDAAGAERRASRARRPLGRAARTSDRGRGGGGGRAGSTSSSRPGPRPARRRPGRPGSASGGRTTPRTRS